MHIVLKPSNRLPRSRPNLVVVKGVRLRFTKWQGDVMVFSSSRAQSVLHMITLKRGDVRRVDKILWKGEYLAQVGEASHAGENDTEPRGEEAAHIIERLQSDFGRARAAERTLRVNGY